MNNPNAAVNPDELVAIIGIDFGTSFSGFTYANIVDTGGSLDTLNTAKVTKYYTWKDALFPTYPKTATALFYRNAQDEAPLMGWEAVKAANRGTHEDWQFQERFKLRLIGRHAELVPLPPHRNENTVIADFLRALSDKALSDFNEHSPGQKLTKRNVLWCLTVPVSFHQASRVALGKIAYMAGMTQSKDAPDNGGSKHPLRIVLEPEAASVYLFNYLSIEAPEDLQVIKTGVPYLIVDCGGGTVDLVVHSRLEEASIREIASSSGGLCGGTYVDKAFFDLIASKMPDYQTWKKSDQFFRLKTEWEICKRRFTGVDDVQCQFPPKILNLFRKPEDEGNDDAPTFTAQEFSRFFDAILDHIIELIEKQLEKRRDIMNVFLLGGFVQCEYLQRRIAEKFQEPGNVFEGRKLFTLPKPEEAVVVGATLLGMSGLAPPGNPDGQRCPDWFETRCMKRSYGIAVALPALPNDRDVELINGQRLSISRFGAIVHANEEIRISHVVKKYYRPNRTDRDTSVTLYSSANPMPHSIKDNDVRLVKEFPIHLSQMGGFGEAGIEISFFFGRTVMEMVLKDMFSGEELPLAQLDIEE